MANEPDYADRLRESLLALATIPIAGLEAATYWAKESLERTSQFGADVIRSTTLARFTQAKGAHDATDPVSDVLAQDLLEALGSYVRSMARLPADVGVYFSGELERRVNALLDQTRPDVEANLERYANNELTDILRELDRLYVSVRAEDARLTEHKAKEATKEGRARLLARIDALRTGVQQARPKLPDTPEMPTLKVPPDVHVAAFNAQKARTKLLQTLRQISKLTPLEPAVSEQIQKMLADFEASSKLPKEGV